MGKRKPEAPAVELPTKAYKTLRNVHHNGDEYGPGEDIDLNDVDAAPLLAHPAAVELVKVDAQPEQS